MQQFSIQKDDVLWLLRHHQNHTKSDKLQTTRIILVEGESLAAVVPAQRKYLLHKLRHGKSHLAILFTLYFLAQEYPVNNDPEAGPAIHTIDGYILSITKLLKQQPAFGDEGTRLIINYETGQPLEQYDLVTLAAEAYHIGILVDKLPVRIELLGLLLPSSYMAQIARIYLEPQQEFNMDAAQELLQLLLAENLMLTPQGLVKLYQIAEQALELAGRNRKMLLILNDLAKKDLTTVPKLRQLVKLLTAEVADEIMAINVESVTTLIRMVSIDVEGGGEQTLSIDNWNFLLTKEHRHFLDNSYVLRHLDKLGAIKLAEFPGLGELLSERYFKLKEFKRLTLARQQSLCNLHHIKVVRALIENSELGLRKIASFAAGSCTEGQVTLRQIAEQTVELSKQNRDIFLIVNISSFSSL